MKTMQKNVRSCPSPNNASLLSCAAARMNLQIFGRLRVRALLSRKRRRKGLGRLTKSLTFDVKTLEALRGEKGSDEGKGVQSRSGPSKRKLMTIQTPQQCFNRSRIVQNALSRIWKIARPLEPGMWKLFEIMQRGGLHLPVLL
jgi:hypothetical protein